MIAVRPAGVDDAEAIAAIAESVRFGDPAAANPDRGYLVNVLTAEEYRDWIAMARWSVVALDGDTVVGFLLASDGEDLAGSQDPGAALAARQGTEGLVFVDQIGVADAGRGQGVAQRMLDAIKDGALPRRMAATIMHGPVRNQRSITFFENRNGFRLMTEAEKAGYVWGVYEWGAAAPAG